MISEGGLSRGGTGHRVLPNSESPLQCDDCHTSHQDPTENPGLLRVRVINVDTGHKVYLYNTAEDPVGNGFCYACHGASFVEPNPASSPSPGVPPEASPGPSPSPRVRGPLEFRANDPLQAPFGDFTGFELSAHNMAGPMSEAAESDAQQLAEDSGDAPAEGTEEDKAQDSQPTGKIMCLYCHAPHESDYDGITTADQELLCYVCHARVDPSTADGTSPYRAFNAADNSYGDDGKGPADGAVRIFHHPIAANEQQDGARSVECVSCHNPHLDATSNTGNSAKIANPRRTSAAWPPSATIRGYPSVTVGDERTTAQTVAPQAVTDDSGPVTFEVWAGALLSQLGAPSCQDNLVTVVAWQAQEGTAARWNPLATTYSMPGASSINTSGVKNYASMAEGLEATRLTLTGSSVMYRYGPIVARLKNCAPARSTVAAIASSAWCACGISGSYLTSVLDAVESNYESYAGTGVSGSASSFDGSMDTVNSFCTKCHIAPDETNPIRESETVPYGIRLVNDTALDPGGQPHDLFTANQYPDSLHGSMTCTACHDVHGSTNAYDLRNKILSVVGSQTTSVSGFGGMNQPEDRQKYAAFCLACHADTAQSHVDDMLAEGTYCRECHYHGSDQF
jgi:predicted CXXCH cytochrome family protein